MGISFNQIAVDIRTPRPVCGVRQQPRAGRPAEHHPAHAAPGPAAGRRGSTPRRAAGHGHQRGRRGRAVRPGLPAARDVRGRQERQRLHRDVGRWPWTTTARATRPKGPSPWAGRPPLPAPSSCTSAASGSSCWWSLATPWRTSPPALAAAINAKLDLPVTAAAADGGGHPDRPARRRVRQRHRPPGELLPGRVPAHRP